MKPVPVEPIGWRESDVFWDGPLGGGYGPVEQRVYPPHPKGEELAMIRKSSSTGLRQAAPLLGLSAEQLSGLEHGRYTFATDAEWDEARRKLGTGEAK